MMLSSIGKGKHHELNSKATWLMILSVPETKIWCPIVTNSKPLNSVMGLEMLRAP